VSQGNITAGLMTLKKAAQVDPRNVKVHLQMGEILRAQNDLDGALSAYRQALTVQPNSAEAQAAIGDILLTKRDFIPAITAYHRLIQLFQNANAYYNLGIALQGQKQNQEAITALSRALTFTSRVQRAEALLKEFCSNQSSWRPVSSTKNIFEGRTIMPVLSVCWSR